MHNHFNLYKFPFEILVEIIISFALVTYGSLTEYTKFEEIMVDKQTPEKYYMKNKLIIKEDEIYSKAAFM